MKGGMHFYRGSGANAGRYFDEGHRGAEAYYSERGRAPVRVDTWRDGEHIASASLSARGALEAWVEGRDPDTGEVKGVIRSGGPARAPLRFVEVVINNPKSLSVVASQDPVVAAALDRVLARQADALSAYMSQVAVTRMGRRGAQVEVGDLELQVARVTHLSSREGDPHRHIHLMANARVRAPDGSWRGLHSVSLRQHIGAINARAHRALVTDARLREVLAARGYTLGADGEIDQARGAIRAMSKRQAMVAERRAAAEAAWRAAHPGREPSQRVRHGWDHQGWERGRPSKAALVESPEALSTRVRAELADLGFDFTHGALVHGPTTAEPEHDALTMVPPQVSVARVERDSLATSVVAALSANRSAWSDAEVAAGVEAAVARSGVVGDPRAVSELVEDVASRARERCVSLLAEEPDALATSMSRRWTSQAVIEADTALNLGLARLVAPAGERDLSLGAGAGAGAGEPGLDPAQVEAVAVIAGEGGLEVVVGPAGAGKTAMLAAARVALESEGRAMVVVAPTRKAAQVASEELGAPATSLSKLLYDHGWRWDELGAWRRLEAGEVDTVTGRAHEGPPASSVLGEASVVVVDEAALVSVDQAVALVEVVAESGAALRLVGDPRQLGAVGRGGVMEVAMRWAGEPVVLDQVHRFLALAPDPDTGLPVTVPDVAYAELSMQMREGADPEGAAEALEARGSLVTHPSRSEAIAAIAEEVAGDASRGASVALTVATNEDARALNQAVRQLRVSAGEVSDAAVATGMEGERIGVGDRVVTRRNDSRAGVANRESWDVLAVRDDGGVLIGGRERRVELSPSYVAEALALGYAATDYGNQGVTAQRSLTWVGASTTAGGLYVGATRGRYANTLHVVAGAREEALELVAAAGRRDRADRGLDEARSRARAQALSVLRDPGNLWRTEEELEGDAASIEWRLREALAGMHDFPVMDPAEVARADAADAARAKRAGDLASWHQGQMEALGASRPRLVEEARTALHGARSDARIVSAGPGLLGRRGAQVREAQARLGDVASRWGLESLPGPQWNDQALAHAAHQAVERALNPRLNHHLAEADKAAQEAHLAEWAISDRRRRQDLAMQINQANASRREVIERGAQEERERLARMAAMRAAIARAMTPEQVEALDAARQAHLREHERAVEQVIARQRGRQRPPPGRSPTEELARRRAMERGRGGPGLEM